MSLTKSFPFRTDGQPWHFFIPRLGKNVGITTYAVCLFMSTETNAKNTQEGMNKFIESKIWLAWCQREIMDDEWDTIHEYTHKGSMNVAIQEN